MFPGFFNIPLHGGGESADEISFGTGIAFRAPSFWGSELTCFLPLFGLKNGGGEHTGIIFSGS